MHALIIEDQVLIAAMIEQSLRDLGYTTFDIATREGQAVAAAEALCPDLITADDRLTDGSGIRAVQTICEKRAIPVVVIAAANGLDLGAIPHAVILPKPFASAAFRDAVAEAIVSAFRPIAE